jgi:O-antigen/teichoic acid export membrane protein
VSTSQQPNTNRNVIIVIYEFTSLCANLVARVADNSRSFSGDMNEASRGSFILTGAAFISAVLTYAFHVVEGWLLTPEGYGAFGVAIAFMMIFGFIVESGIPPAVTRFFSGSRQDKGNILRSALIGNFIIGLAAGGVLYLFLRLSDFVTEYHNVVIVLVVTVIIISLASVCRYALQGLFRFIKVGLFDVLNKAIMLLFGVVLVLAGLDVLGAILGIAIGALLATLLTLYWLRDTGYWRGTGLAAPGLYKLAAPMLLGTLVLILFMYVDIIGMKFLKVPEEFVGYYQSAVTLARLPVVIMISVMGAIFPFISRYAETDKGRQYIAILVKYSLVFLVPVSIAFIVVPGRLLTLFFPLEYLPASGALAVVSAGMIFLVLVNILARGFQGLGYPRIPAVWLPLALVVQILLLYFLIPRYGLLGAAAATTAACFLGLLFMLWQGARHRFGLGFSYKILISYAIMAVLLYYFPGGNGRMLTILSIIVAGVLYLASIKAFRLVTSDDLGIILSGVLPKEGFIFKCLVAIVSFGTPRKQA